MLKILSAKTLAKLEKEAENYDIESLGSLSISNGNYFLSFLGKLKETPMVIPAETYVKPEEAPSKPEVPKDKPKAKAKPKTRRKTTKS